MTFQPQPVASPKAGINPILKLALELGPLGVFFFANARGDWLAEKIPALQALGKPIYVATALFIGATLISLTASLILTRRLPIMPLVTAIVVAVFGGLTLALHDDTFIKMKPTIVNVLFGGVLLGGLAFGKSLLGYVFDSAFKLSDAGWRTLTIRWGIFFLVLAALNEIVWRSVSTDMWVNFKVFAIMPLTFIFSMTQAPLIIREHAEAEAAAGPTS